MKVNSFQRGTGSGAVVRNIQNCGPEIKMELVGIIS